MSDSYLVVIYILYVKLCMNELMCVPEIRCIVILIRICYLDFKKK